MNKIKHLTADQIARHAMNVFLSGGRQAMGAALIYRCLEMNPNHALGLRCLSDMLDTDGTEHFSAVVLEYILNGPVELDEAERKEIEALLFRSKWVWGFSRHSSGRTDLSRDDFTDPDEFVLDEPAYESFRKELTDRAGDADAAVRSAHVLVGVLAGILKSDERGAAATMESLLGDEVYERDSAYHDFMDQLTVELDKISAELEEKRNPPQ